MQEQPKPPPPKKRKIQKPRAKSSRLVSLALSGTNTPGRKLDRNTIGWATPNTMAKIMEEEEQLAALNEDEEDDLFEEGDEDANPKICVSFLLVFFAQHISDSVFTVVDIQRITYCKVLSIGIGRTN